ncbi:hypothetical protein ACLBWS_16525 [Brucellaceae bacterium D45D]
MKKLIIPTAIAMAALTTAAFTAVDANAQALKSSYTNTDSCSTIEHADDRFTLECLSPAGGGLVLSYWDGRAYVTSDLRNKQSTKPKLRNIADNAPRAFGQKVEWRTRNGDQAPCAAIVRVYSTKAGILVVNDLRTGKHLGDAKSNVQAKAMADKACLKASKDNAVESLPKDRPVGKSEGTITKAAMRASSAFSGAYRMGGISEVVDQIKDCYRTFEKKPSRANLAYCAALDILGGNVDAAMTERNPSLGQRYFGRGLSTDKRIDTGLRKLGLSKQQSKAFEQELADALGAHLNN